MGQGLNLSHSFDLHHSCSNIRSLTHCATVGTPKYNLTSSDFGVSSLFFCIQGECLTYLILVPAQELYSFFFFSFSFCLFRAAPLAYGSSQARGESAAAASLCHSHSNTRSEPCLRPTPQLTATRDPSPTEQGQRLNPSPHGY